MKRRRLIISLFLIVAVVLLGIGYSAISKELKLNGRIDGVQDDTDFIVEFLSGDENIIKDSASTSTLTIQPTFTNNQTVNLVVTNFTNIGDTATVYFKIQNNSIVSTQMDATLAVPFVSVTTASTEAIDNDASKQKFVGNHFIIFAEYVTVDPDGEGVATAATGTVSVGTDKDGDKGPMATLNAPTAESSSNGQTVWLKVTVEMMDVVTQSQTHNITITFDAYTK